jgi:hypothetical protein
MSYGIRSRLTQVWTLATLCVPVWTLEQAEWTKDVEILKRVLQLFQVSAKKIKKNLYMSRTGKGCHFFL